MKAVIHAGLTALLLLSSVRAESIDEQLAALKARREAALREAAAAIDKKFAENAKLLLAKAIQAGDLDVAVKIRGELKLTETSSAKVATDKPGTGSQDASKAQIRRMLVASSWKSRGMICNFDESGGFRMAEHYGTYSINDDGRLTLRWSTGWSGSISIASDSNSLKEEDGGYDYQRVPKQADSPAKPSADPKTDASEDPFGQPTGK